jgi:putative Holliday junction resolvase
MSRVLAVDVGSKTLGLALSDESATVGMPLTTLERRGLRRDIERLREIAETREVAEVVVGLPLNLDGSPGAMSGEADRIAGAIESELGLSVQRWDERLTTVAAERVLLEADVSRRGRRKVIDKLAAALILQGFLDRRNLERESRP